MSNMNENLKKTIDDLDLDRRLDEFGTWAQKTFAGAKAQVGSLAHDNREKVDGWVAKATQTLDAKTDGKYHDKATKFGVAVSNAVDKVAEQRHTGPQGEQPGDAGGSAPGNPATPFAPESGPHPGFPPPGPGTAFTPQYPSDAPPPADPGAFEAESEDGKLGWPDSGDGRVH